VASPELSLADQACLAVIGESPTHGWAIVKLLAPDGELGRIWSLSRPLTYRSIERLVDLGLVDRREAGRRAELGITAAGRRRRRAWLDAPVTHLRDLRTEFLLKLALRERAGIEADDLFERQLAILDPAIVALTRHEPRDAVGRWRREAALAARRFLEHR
jgi:PadR family transcriptional regulator AphA